MALTVLLLQISADDIAASHKNPIPTPLLNLIRDSFGAEGKERRFQNRFFPSLWPVARRQDMKYNFKNMAVEAMLPQSAWNMHMLMDRAMGDFDLENMLPSSCTVKYLNRVKRL